MIERNRQIEFGMIPNSQHVARGHKKAQVSLTGEIAKFAEGEKVLFMVKGTPCPAMVDHYAATMTARSYWKDDDRRTVAPLYALILDNGSPVVAFEREIEKAPSPGNGEAKDQEETA